jgi:hypothetical protein
MQPRKRLRRRGRLRLLRLAVAPHHQQGVAGAETRLLSADSGSVADAHEMAA